MKKIGFEALIKEVKIKSLSSGDKSAWITLQVDDPADDLVDGINRLHRADAFVGVAIAGKGK